MSTKKGTRRRTTPGEILNEEYLVPLKLTQKQLADRIGCDIKVINRIVNGQSAVTVPIAIKFAAAFKTTPEFWLNAQQAVDIDEALRGIKKLPEPYEIELRSADSKKFLETAKKAFKKHKNAMDKLK